MARRKARNPADNPILSPLSTGDGMDLNQEVSGDPANDTPVVPDRDINEPQEPDEGAEMSDAQVPATTDDVMTPAELSHEMASDYETAKARLRDIARQSLEAEDQGDNLMLRMCNAAYKLHSLAEHHPELAARIEQECKANNLDQSPDHANETTRLVRLVMMQDNDLKKQLEDRDQRTYWKQRLNEMANTVKLLNHQLTGSDDPKALPPPPEAIPDDALDVLVEAVGGRTKAFREGRKVGKEPVGRYIELRDNSVHRLSEPVMPEVGERPKVKREIDPDKPTAKEQEALSHIIEMRKEIKTEGVYVMVLTVGPEKLSTRKINAGVEPRMLVQTSRIRRVTPEELYRRAISYDVIDEAAPDEEVQLYHRLAKVGRNRVRSGGEEV